MKYTTVYCDTCGVVIPPRTRTGVKLGPWKHSQRKYCHACAPGYSGHKRKSVLQIVLTPIDLFLLEPLKLWQLQHVLNLPGLKNAGYAKRNLLRHHRSMSRVKSSAPLFWLNVAETRLTNEKPEN